MNYTSIAATARAILEKVAKHHTAPDGGPEQDMNDQIAVGSYQTKSFEMSNKAQKLYSNLPKDTPSASAESAAIYLDKIFDMYKHAAAASLASEADWQLAQEYADKVRKLAKDIGLEIEHESILQDVLRKLQDYASDNPPRVIKPEDHVHPSDDPRFKTHAKNYNTDRTNDRDVDNVKNYLIRRSLKAQRKLKIIDND